MITCFVRYRFDRRKLREFEAYAKMWIPLVKKFGGQHHGYFLPSEGKSDEAICLFSFESLADYETYRIQSATDKEVQAVLKYGEDNVPGLEWDRTFFRPVFE
jgi:hypothetical protein